jgi:two-component system response regulator VicR
MKQQILVVEDDAPLAQVLRDNFLFEGYGVDIASDGAEALAKIRAQPPDLVLLDLMIPTLDGFEVCRQLGLTEPRTPIVILTARGQAEDKIRGLQLGADDYVTKPFVLEELMARIHAVLRRARPGLGRVELGDVTVDFVQQRAWREGQAITLTMREFELLQYLVERAGTVATREELLHSVWGYQETTLTRTVDNFIARLRRKIESDPHHPRHIRTAHGGGYCLVR